MKEKEGWEILKVKDICDKASSNVSQNKIQDNEGSYPIYGASGFIKNIDFYHQKNEYIGLIKDGAGVGRIQLLPTFSSVIGTLQYILPKKCYLIKYIKYCLQSLNLSKYATGATIPHIYFRDYGEVKLKIAMSISIQQQIVSELDSLSDIITKKKQQLVDLDNLAQATFYDMFGDPVNNEKGWVMKRLEDLGQWASGGTPSRSVGSYFTGNINWYSAGELNNLFLPPSEEKITETAIKESSAKLFKPNSLFVGMYDTAAFKMGITLTDASSNQACANILPNSSVSIVFLYFMLKEMKEHFLKMRRGIRQQNLNLGMIKKFHIPLPPLYLQTHFVEKTEAIEKQKELINKSIDDVQQLFDYTMDKYFN